MIIYLNKFLMEILILLYKLFIFLKDKDILYKLLQIT